ncbi:YceI family protein [Vogesella oryzae]|uniref:YceI family protein n=1 Tax=Vogesella oryzae TaxID=1735285 RepID=UPI0015827467|nr:YceI family protein [Vogesella oryzae]
MKHTLLLLPLLAAPAFAQPVDAAKSQMVFTMKQMGVPVSGSFKKFAANVSFNPAQPDAGKADISIDIGSISLPTAEANAEARKKDWFNSAQFPQARFVSSSIKPLGNNRFQVNGKLTLKGITRDISAPFQVTTQGKLMTVDGAIPLSRLAFKIGEGSWSDTSTVADTVDLKFRLVLNNA